MINAQELLQKNAGAHPTIGLKAKRSCTDCWCLLIFILTWAAMIALAVIAFDRGNPLRLLYGTDYLGNICGDGSAPVGYNMSDAEWSERTLLWYPITFDPIHRKMILTEAIDLGICVKTCPTRADIKVTSYEPAVGNTNVSAAVTYPILFNSASQLYRCVPDFLTFDCANATDCLTNLQNAASQFSVVNDALELGQAGVREIIDGWWVILVGLIAGVLLSFLWVFTLRRTVKPIVVLFIILVLALLVGGGVLCFLQMKSLKDDPVTAGSDAVNMWLAAAIILWGFAFICLVVLIFVGKHVMIACDIIEEAAKVPIAIPTMNAVPIFIFLGALLFAAFAVAVAVFIQSCGNTLTIDGYRPVYNSSTTDFSDIASLMRNTSAVDQYYEAHTFVFEGWRIYAHLYNIFMFLWTFGILSAIGYMIFSLCNVFWYWSNPGDEKSPPLGSVCIALKIAVRYHLGSLALGAFIVAVVQLMRIILVFISKKAKETGADQQAQVKFCLRCLHCFLACLERLITFINKNAYIIMAHDGTNFVASAQLALDLLTGNTLVVGMTNIIAELFMFFGKFQIALFAGGITFLITHFVESAGNGVSKGIILIFIVTIVSYLIATLFLSVLGCCVDSLLMCFCYDKIYSEVDYYPEDLAKHIDVRVDEAKAKRRAAAMAAGQTDTSDNISGGIGAGGGIMMTDKGAALVHPTMPAMSQENFSDLL